MKRSSWRPLLIAAGVVVAFAAGQVVGLPDSVASALEPSEWVLPQDGRGARPPLGDRSGETDVAPPPTAAPLVYSADNGNSGQANGFIAVTGSYGVGTSVLYVLDTVGRQLAVYEARGGTTNSRRLVFVGARRIDLDLQLEGYNDDSDFSYRDLAEKFTRREVPTRDTRGAGTPPEGAVEKTGGGEARR